MSIVSALELGRPMPTRFHVRQVLMISDVSELAQCVAYRKVVAAGVRCAPHIDAHGMFVATVAHSRMLSHHMHDRMRS